MQTTCEVGGDKNKKVLSVAAIPFQQHDQHLLGPAARQQAITTQRIIRTHGMPKPRLKPNLQPKLHGPLESESSAVRSIVVVTGTKLNDVDIPV